MTLIVGIKCSDGVVLGADGAATFGNLGQHTIRQPVRKLTLVQNRLIVGVSGPVGLGQRIAGEVLKLSEAGELSCHKPHEMGPLIRGKIFDLTWGPELNVAAIAQKALGQAGVQGALSATLIAVSVSETPCLVQFDHLGAPELATDDLPFVAVGSGEPIADTFLAFLKQIFWPKRLPNLQEGILTAVWTLDQAIKTHPGGVADPIQIATLRQEGKEPVARELAEQELEEHRQAISAAEKTLTEYLCALHRPHTPDEVPPPPKP